MPTIFRSHPGWLLLGVLSLLTATGDISPAAEARESRPGIDPKLAAVELHALRFQDPPLQLHEVVRVFPAGLKDLWLKAIERGEADLQRQAADAVVQAQQLGMEGLSDFEPALTRLAGQPEIHPLVHLSVARALIALDARHTAPALAAQAERSGLSYAQVVEPALAEWGYAPRREYWRQQVGDAHHSIAERILAVRCLRAASDAEALPMLEQVVLDRRENAGLRLEAARGVAALGPDRAVALASSLVSSLVSSGAGTDRSESGPDARNGLIDRLSAAAMLQAAENEEGVRLLEQFTADPEPAVAALAIERLLEVAPDKVVNRSEQLLANRDARVRLLTARCLASQPAPEQVETLAGLLADPHPHVRRFARASLLEMSRQDSLDALVREKATNMLTGDDWRALEQAALLVAQLEHAPAAPRLVGLLDQPRREVLLSAAWALRELAVPETFADILTHAQAATERLQELPKDRVITREEFSRVRHLPGQLTFLFELFGAVDYQPAEEVLRKFVPKDGRLGHDARAAAIWALGKLHAGEEDEQLAEQLADRLSDLNLFDPENDEVRRLSAVSLGRMEAGSQLKTLRQFQQLESGNYIGRSCAWSISRITGEPLREPGKQEVPQSGWFIEPLRRRGQ